MKIQCQKPSWVHRGYRIFRQVRMKRMSAGCMIVKIVVVMVGCWRLKMMMGRPRLFGWYYRRDARCCFRVGIDNHDRERTGVMMTRMKKKVVRIPLVVAESLV